MQNLTFVKLPEPSGLRKTTGSSDAPPVSQVHVILNVEVGSINVAISILIVGYFIRNLLCFCGFDGLKNEPRAILLHKQNFIHKPLYSSVIYTLLT
jgi:hypothetical protein